MSVSKTLPRLLFGHMVFMTNDSLAIFACYILKLLHRLIPTDPGRVAITVPKLNVSGLG